MFLCLIKSLKHAIIVLDFDFELWWLKANTFFQTKNWRLFMQKTKQFHLGDVLSIITGRLISPRRYEGVNDILGFITEGNPFKRPLEEVRFECRPYLVEQFPQLASAEMDFAVAELDDLLEITTSDAQARRVVVEWLAKQVAKHGEMFLVKSLPVDTHRVKSPIAKAIEVMGGCQKSFA